MAEENTPLVENPEGDPQQDVTEPQDQLEGDQLPEDQELDEGQQQEVTRDAKLQNDMQAWTGRKLKDFKDEIMGGMANLLNEQHAKQPVPQQQVQQPAVAQSDPEPDTEYGVTKDWIQWNDRQKSLNAVNVQQQADQAYFGTIESPQVRHSDDAIHEAVKLEMKTSGNAPNVDPQTGQPLPPSADAIWNYNKALSIVMEKKYTKPEGQPTQNPLQGNPIPQPGIGVSQPGHVDNPSPAAMPTNLSSESQKLIDRAGWNAEKVREVLGNK